MPSSDFTVLRNVHHGTAKLGRST